MTTKTALPPLATYELWLDNQDPRAKGAGRLLAREYRRIAELRRAGMQWETIGQRLSTRGTTCNAAWNRLPEELR